MPDACPESKRKGILAMLVDYPWNFALDCQSCPRCKGKTRVLNVREVGAIVRRRRECLNKGACGIRFSTWERIAPGKAARIVSNRKGDEPGD